MTDRADAEGRACVLEATSERSRRLYERHGFACAHDFRATRKAPPIFFMVRAPAAAEAGGRAAGGQGGAGSAAGAAAAAAGGMSEEQQRLIRSLSAAKVAALMPLLEAEGPGDTIKAGCQG
jgi:hypothetical protein